ncbi:MAG: hypothetical protein IT437_05330 [Phycisphaerales bacterium]|nr:hypothetical protein [Phycisphaerales bacterium]
MPGIVITGTGLAVNLGLSPASVWDAMASGTSALGPMAALEQRPERDKGGGQAAELPAEFHPHLDRAARYMRYVVERALERARSVSGRIPCGTEPGRARARPVRTAVVMGTTLHGMRAAGAALRTGDLSRLRGFLAGSVLEQALGGLGITGPMLTTCSACSSGLGSIALGATLLAGGAADAVIAGGYDSVSEYSYAGFDSLGLVAAGLPRPFVADRDGMKVSEGYAAVILERARDASARGADVLAALAGFGETSDSFHLTQPQPEGRGAARAIRAALRDAGMEHAEIDLIVAHATATPNNDAAEYAALAAVFSDGLPKVPVAALKSHLGHTLGGAGAVELVLAVEAMRRQLAPPTAGHHQPQFGGLRLVRAAPLPHRIRRTINLSLGFGGANTCIVLAPPRASARHRPAEGVAITGVGLVLPGAATPEELVHLVSRGRRVESDTGPIPEAAYQHPLGARRTRRMSDYAKLTLAAATAACADAGLGPGSPELAESSAVLGTTQGSTNFCEAYYGQIVREGPAAANPALFAEGVPNAAAAHLSMALGLQGGCQTLIGSRRAGLDALALAALRIREGRWTRAVVSAAEEYSELVARAYEACGLGRVPMGAGAVAIILERAPSAAARGRPPIAMIGPPTWTGPGGALDGPGPIAASLGPMAADRAASAALTGRRVLNVAGALPEMFSAGPLAALAYALAAGEPAFEVLSVGTLGSCTRLGIAAHCEPGFL